jgi:hypothetical protein
VGGTCLNKGCIPTKVLLHASKEFAAAKNFESYGIKIKGAELDWAGIQKRKAEIVDKQVKGIEGLLVNNKVVKIKGEGSFISKNQLKVKDGDGSETRVDFDYAIIATGSKPFIIPIPCSPSVEKAPFSHRSILAVFHKGLNLVYSFNIRDNQALSSDIQHSKNRSPGDFFYPGKGGKFAQFSGPDKFHGTFFTIRTMFSVDYYIV